MAFKRSGVRFPSPPWRGRRIEPALLELGGLPRRPVGRRRLRDNAGIAQLVEHNLAKVGVAGSSPVSRSRKHTDAGWSSLVARRAHNPEVVGSNPTPATETRNVERRTRNWLGFTSAFRLPRSAFLSGG